jgi:hypothetical protein
MGPLLARTLTSRPRARASSRESSFRFIVRQRHVIIGKRKMRRIRRLEILWLDAGLRTGKGAILIRERTKAPRCREAPWQIRRKVSLITLYPGPEGIAVSTVTLKANGRKFAWFCGCWMAGRDWRREGRLSGRMSGQQQFQFTRWDEQETGSSARPRGPRKS